MRRALPWLLCAVALAAVVAPMAQGTASAKDPRVAGLIAKVNALQGKVTALQGRVGPLEAQVNDLKTASDALVSKTSCIHAQGAVLRGIAADDGYFFRKSGDTTNIWLESAFDAPLQGEAPQIYFATVTAGCVTASYGVRAAGITGRAPSIAHLAQAGR